MRVASKWVNCFGNGLKKSSFKFFKSCVTLGPKRKPLQLLSHEGDHAGHLVLLAHVCALVSYQEHACPLLKPLLGFIDSLYFTSFSCGLKIMANAVSMALDSIILGKEI